MHPDDDSQTTLSKWPFIIGDVLLVATALAIAILGHWQLTGLQMVACVASVALGAALFVLPYIVEYQVRIREELEDRAADIRILEKHLLVAEQAIDSSDARIRALESAAAEAADPNAALAEVMDQKVAQLEAARAAQEEVIQALRKNLEELAAKEPPPAFDPKVLKPIEMRLKALEDKPAPVVEAPAPEREAPQPPKPEPQEVEPKVSDAKPAPVAKPETPDKTTPAEPQKIAAPIERPQREARERHGPEESRLLKRAISEKGDKSSTAVSRIIESKMKEKEKAAEAPKETESPEPETEKGEPAAQEKEAPKVEKPEPVEKEAPKKKEPKTEESKSEPKEEEPEVPPQAEVDDDKDSDNDEDLKPETAPTEPVQEPEPEPKSEAKPESESSDHAPASPDPGMLFDAEKITSPITRTKAKKNDAVLTASVFIGIGNKPYLRGSGGGLSWETGQFMEFQEIGKWRWVAPSDLEGPLELQIYRNDEDPDKSGKFTLEPGQKLEVTPVF